MSISTIWGSEDVILERNGIVIKELISHAPLSIQIHKDKIETFTAVKESWLLTMSECKLQDIINTLRLERFKTYCMYGELSKAMTRIHLTPGRSYCIPQRTVHYLLANSHVIETSYGTQETLRLHDWGRPRRLDIEEVYNMFKR